MGRRTAELRLFSWILEKIKILLYFCLAKIYNEITVKKWQGLNRKGVNHMEVLDMAISEKELKLLMNFVKDDLKEARESEDTEKKNSKIDRVLEHIQQYLED